jgi:hypothetical protein
MLDYVGRTGSARKAHQQRLNEPPRVGVRDWRSEMDTAERRRFEAVAGDLLDELGYETAARSRSRARLASYRLRTAAWRGVAAALQRSGRWERRHPPLQ